MIPGIAKLPKKITSVPPYYWADLKFDGLHMYGRPLCIYMQADIDLRKNLCSPWLPVINKKDTQISTGTNKVYGM